jgi:peptide/nickel transport system substrate-binding protein
MDSIELPDPLTVTMKLKPGMVYHNLEPANGRAVKASDIVATQNYVKTLPNAENSQFQRTFIDTIEAPDDSTVVLHLKQPSAYLFSSTYLANPTAQPIIPAEMLNVLDTHTAVGSGPFQLTDNIFGQKYSYKKFENFREAKNGMPYFATRETYGLIDNVALEASFRSGQISEWTPPNSIVDRLNTELDKTKSSSVQYLAVGQIGINSMMNVALGGPRPWNDIRVREAFYRLTNRQQWVDLGYAGKAVTNPGPLQASLVSYQLDPKDTEKYFVEDVNAAKQLLSAANYDTNAEWEVICSNSVSTNSQLAEIWQQEIGRAGIKIRIVSLPLATILPQKMSVAQFDFWVGGQPGGDTPARAMRNQHSTTNDVFNNVGLYDPEVDALIEKSETTIDHDENISLVKQIQMKALDLYSLSYDAVTAQAYLFYDARLREFLVDALTGQDYQYQAWLDA